MQDISLVVAMNQDRVIGNDNNQLPWHIPEDLAYFKQVTLGKTIIMGRKTFDSIGHPLAGRKNIILSKHNSLYPGTFTYNNLELAICDNNDAEICIIGGSEVFAQALVYATKLYLTKVEMLVANPGAWFPAIDFNKWQLIKAKSITTKANINCKFQIFKKLINNEIIF